MRRNRRSGGFPSWSTKILVAFALLGAGASAFGGQIPRLHVTSPDLGQVLSGDAQTGFSAFASPPSGSPQGLAIDASGNVYVASSADGAIYVHDSSGSFVREIRLDDASPFGIFLESDGNLLVVEQTAAGNRLERFDSTGASLGIVAALEGTASYSLAKDRAGRIFYTDLIDGLLRRVGGPSVQFAGHDVVAVAAGADGAIFIALSRAENLILRWDLDAGPPTIFARLGSAVPQGIAVGGDGFVYASIFDADTGGYGIDWFDRHGSRQGRFGEDLLNPTFLAIAPTVATVPEPSTLAALSIGIGCAWMTGVRSRRRSR